jgi:imidazolonepropionase-like amidohydrolase
MDHVKLAVMHQSYAEKPLPAVTEPVARAVVAEAHRSGLRVLAHAHSVADYRVALAAGVDALMHSSFEPLDPDTVARVRDAGIPVCPTLWVFESVCLGAEMRFDSEPRFTRHVAGYIRNSWRRFVEAYAAAGDVVPPGIAGGLPKTRAHDGVRVAAANLMLLRDAGVPIAFGNDASYGFSLVARPVDELTAMQRAGMDPTACLRAATTGAAALLGCADRGALKVGTRADLLVVDRRVRTDVAALDSPLGVIAAGQRLEGARGSWGSGLAFARGLASTVASLLRSGGT